MKPWLLPSGLQRGIPFILSEDWTPEQALAVVELLDDLREMIWNHYQIQLHALLRDQSRPLPDDDASGADSTDPPF